MSRPYSHNTTSWADDDDDGTLDVNDTAALIARMEEVHRRQTIDLPVRTIPQPNVRNPHVEPAVNNGRDTQSLLSSEPLASLRRRPRSAGSSGGDHEAEPPKTPSRVAQLAGTSSRMTADGVPLLNANIGSAQGQTMPAKNWNLFASHLQSSAAPAAAMLLQHLQDSEGNAATSTSSGNAEQPPKKKRKHRQRK